MTPHPEGTGWIEVICGPMFSGKTEELIRRLRRAELARRRVVSFKPARDNRYDAQHIVSHGAQRHDGRAVETSADLRAVVPAEAEVVGINEVQFFDAGIISVIDDLATSGKRVIVAGLEQDYLGRPFEPVPQLLALAEYITKTLAICMKCGNPAGRSQRLVSDGARVLVAGHESYEARCQRCFIPEVAPKQEEMQL